MDLISAEQRNALIKSARTVLKLELRDNYAIDEELFAAWRSGDSATLARFVERWRAELESATEAGLTMRRVKVVSEPLSEYHKYILSISKTAVDAGEDIRWLPRQLVSAVLLPGNDFFVLDDETVMFNVFGGDNQRAEIQLSKDPHLVKLCLAAFETAWGLAIRYHEYRPAV